MNRPDLYNKTVDILYQAYFNDTLRHEYCTACAVGNIIAANINVKVSKDENPLWYNNNGEEVMSLWDTVFVTISGEQQLCLGNYCNEAKNEIDATGYALIELAKIEKEFEGADYGLSNEDWMFNGLVAVLDVLAQIHEVTDQDLISTNSKRFSNHYKTLTPCPVTNAIS